MRPVVLIESPYSGKGTEAIRYLACCLLDSVLHGEAPIASHAILPLCLPENVESYGGKTGRKIGLECRESMSMLLEWRTGEDCEPWHRPHEIQCVRYVDLDISRGMARNGNYLPNRELEGEALRVWSAGEWPSKTRWSSTNE
jgi:hypothetical protein